MPFTLSIKAYCDNALAIYLEDTDRVLRLLKCDRPIKDSKTKISHLDLTERNVWELAYLYIVAWSDRCAAQWMKASLNASTGLNVITGDAVWAATAIGNQSVRLEIIEPTDGPVQPNWYQVTRSDDRPDPRQLATWLSMRRTWTAPSSSMAYGLSVQGAAAVWLDCGRQKDATAPFALGFDHDEPLVFRVPLLVLACSLELYFPFDKSATLVDGTNAAKQLDRLAEQLKMIGAKRITGLSISGHTSQEGTAEYNARLSNSRAEYVKQVLGNKGVTQAMKCQGFGFSQPKDPSNGANPANRRVMIEFER